MPSVQSREAAKASVLPATNASSLPDLSGATSGSLALRWTALLDGARQKPALSPSEEELLRSQERELAEELKKKFSEDPSRWMDVLEVLSQEDPRIGRMIISTLKDAVVDAAEPALVRGLKEGRHREVRLSSATLLGARTSGESLRALLSAAQEDADSGVRYKALSELAVRQGRSGASTETTTIDEVLRLRARVDPDPAVRRFALGATGQSAEAENGTLSAPAPPPQRRLLRSN